MAKFPFTVDAAAAIRESGISADDLAEEEYSQILSRAITRVRQGVFEAKIAADRVDADDMMVYPVALLLISVLGDDRAKRRYALAESKRAYQLLRGTEPETLLHIATGTFGWKAKAARELVGEAQFPLALHFAIYTKNAVKILDEKWKLINRVLHDGYVLLPRDDFARLLEVEIEQRVRSRMLDSLELPDSLAPLTDPLRLDLAKWAATFVSEEAPKQVVAEAMPPCIINLLAMMQAGKHMSHMGNFTLASFLLNIGVKEEEALKMFTQLTDFDERQARYQIEHLAGKRGSKQVYTPPNCATMKTHGLCINPDQLCATIKHPLSYYRRKARWLSHTAKEKEKTNGKS